MVEVLQDFILQWTPSALVEWIHQRLDYLMVNIIPTEYSVAAFLLLSDFIFCPRLDAESRRSNAFPVSCPIVTPHGNGIVQSYNVKRDAYSVDIQGVVAEIPASDITTPRVHDLLVYPIKSCGGVHVDNAQILKRGLACDRQWLVIDAKNEAVTLKTHPKMALIHPIVDFDKPDVLTLTAQGMAPLVVPVVKSGGVERTVRCFKDIVQAIDQGDAAATWIATFLDEPAFRLVRFKDSYHRECDPNNTRITFVVAFANELPILLSAAASLESIQTELKRPITIERFRPNIVVSGCPAWADDTWRDFEIGGLRFRNVKPCPRCIKPSIDPATGIKDDETLSNIQEVLKAQRNGQRLGFLGKSAHQKFFGTYVVCDTMGSVSVGDPVKVLTVF
ncbi:hypothetical protein AeRB84_000151 [Aphanomyces euteiches]|nr:hypothetical protein AeRB84_000151 [Aphanomyces euteiches]